VVEVDKDGCKLRADFLACCWAAAEVVVTVDVEVVSFCRSASGIGVCVGGVADGVHATVDNRQAMSMCSMLRHGSRRFYLKVEERRDMRRLHFSPTQRLLLYY